MSTVAFDPSKYSKAALRVMLSDPGMAHIHPVIDAFLAPSRPWTKCVFGDAAGQLKPPMLAEWLRRHMRLNGPAGF